MDTKGEDVTPGQAGLERRLAAARVEADQADLLRDASIRAEAREGECITDDIVLMSTGVDEKLVTALLGGHSRLRVQVDVAHDELGVLIREARREDRVLRHVERVGRKLDLSIVDDRLHDNPDFHLPERIGVADGHLAILERLEAFNAGTRRRVVGGPRLTVNIHEHRDRLSVGLVHHAGSGEMEARRVELRENAGEIVDLVLIHLQCVDDVLVLHEQHLSMAVVDCHVGHIYFLEAVLDRTRVVLELVEDGARLLVATDRNTHLFLRGEDVAVVVLEEADEGDGGENEFHD